jgi:hypothetical protein
VRFAPSFFVALGDGGEPCEIREAERMERRARREREGGVTAALDEEPRTKRHATFALAPPRAEARVSLQRFDVVVTARDRVLQLVERDVLAAADEDLGH